MSDQVTPELEQKFKDIAEGVRTGKPRKTTNEQKLAVYSLYKQATIGDNNQEKPWAVQLEASAKWNAWNDRKGMSKKQAMEEYIKLIGELDAQTEDE